MSDNTGVAAEALPAARSRPIGVSRPVSRGDVWLRALLVLAAWLVYAQSAEILGLRNATYSFGADSLLYGKIAFGDVWDRLTRFHPVTVLLAVGWMKSVGAVFSSMEPLDVLAMLFAGVGAAGVWAALSAFSVLVPRRFVLLCGLIYAASLGSWYFASIAESKIVTASLATLYIAIYLHLRERWTRRLGVWLTATLFAACMNEIVSALLVAIPVVDHLMRAPVRGAVPRWILRHALAVPAAFLAFEIGINHIVLDPATDAEGGSAFKMFIYYVSVNDHDLASLYSFLLNWFFFNIAAPQPAALHSVVQWQGYQGYFAPAFSNYFSTLTSSSLVAVVALMSVISLMPRYRAGPQGLRGLMWALLAYSLMRGAFFFVFNPPEAMLFSPAVTLPHLILVLVPFAVSRFRAKGPVLFAVAGLLFLTNLQFIGGEWLSEPPVPL